MSDVNPACLQWRALSSPLSLSLYVSGSLYLSLSARETKDAKNNLHGSTGWLAGWSVARCVGCCCCCVGCRLGRGWMPWRAPRFLPPLSPFLTWSVLRGRRVRPVTYGRGAGLRHSRVERREGGEEEKKKEERRQSGVPGRAVSTAHWPQVDWTWRAPRRKSTRRNYYGPSKER